MRGSSGEGPSLRQATLFQAWGRKKKKSRPDEEEEEEEEEGAAHGARAEEEDLEEANEEEEEDGGGSSAWLFPVAAPASSSSASPLSAPPPLLLLPRGYQARAAGAALASNTLLCLPTGLGKTRVAAAVLFNFSRWFPRGKSLFLAPTRPLVAQQRRACHGILPARHTALLLAHQHGGTQIADRKEIWRTKRVFFLTPQIMVNDLSRGICPAAEVKCLVIDEAHKALGNHAYCQVVKELCKYTKDFRILALTATPGSNTKAVQQVISNLLISHIEVCSEDSPEIQPYSHERQVEKCVIPLGKELGDIQAAYIQVLEAFVGRLVRLRVLSQREIPSLTKYQIILARDQFRKTPPSRLGGMQPGAIEGDFALCIRLYHGYELLLQMGMRSLYLFLSGIMDGSKGMTRAKNELSRNEDFIKLYSQLENMFSDTAVTSADGSHPNIGTRNGKPFIYSHPKLKKLEEVVTEHFRSWKERGEQEAPGGRLADTRVMIFSSFRDSVQEIAEMLSRHFPAVRAMTFVGHSSGKSTKGFTQKEQLEVVRRFCEGGYNTLVSTCVGEEGLDIGEVDLIVCFDAQRSPIRLVQRMGRTGRKRQGRVVVLLSEGREERAYDQSQSNSRNLLKALSENKGLQLYQHSPRVIPEGVNPQMHRLLIIPEEEEPGGGPSWRERGGHSHRQKGRPYSTSSPGAEPPSLSKSWCLTAEEFGRWDRLYRMKAGDGIRKIAMPPSHFETLEEEEEEKERAPPDPETLELSLTEWRLWQSRPFPTSLVDHSDRCRHFIDVMGMIEQMRQEEGDCSYEQKMKPHFHWEDVDASSPPPPPPPQRSKSGPDAVAPPKPSVPKRPLVDFASKAKWMSLPTEEELDAESVSLFKATSFKPARRPPGPSGGATGQADLSPHPECFSASGLPAVEDSGPDENQEDEDNSLGGSPLRGGCASPERAKPRGLQPVLAQSGLRVDSCPSGSAEEALPLPSSLFYFPASEADPSGPSGAKVDEDPSWRKQILTTTMQLLSQSPPALEEMMLAFEGKSENGGQPLGAPGSGVFGVPADEGTARGPDHPRQALPEPPGTHGRRSSSGPWETSLTLEASVSQMSDLNWEELFENDDDDGSVGVPGEEGGGGGGLPVVNRGLKVDPVGKDDGGRCPGSGERLWRNPSADEKAVPLLESHCFTERSSPSPGREGGRPAVRPDPCRPADPRTHPAGTAVEDQPSGGLPAAFQAAPRSPLTPERDVSLGAAGEKSLLPLPPGPYNDASQELFSVNFDLGFSLQESEEEASERGSPVEEGGGGRRPALGSSLGWGGTRRTPPSSSSRERLDRATFSTPLPSKSHNGGLSAAGPALPWVSPLTPAGEKRCQTPGSDPSPLATTAGGRGTVPQRGGSRGGSAGSLLLGKRRESPEGVPLLLRSRKASHTIVKALAKAAFKTEDPGSREAGKMGPKDGPQGCPARAGSSSESEGEIIFLRKTKRKRNVLTSPRIQSYDLESPVRAIKRKRCLLIASDPSSDESADFAEQPRRGPGDSTSGRSKKPRQGVKRWKRKESAAAAEAAKDFLDDQAEVSAEGAAQVSSDESLASEDELSSSLVQFVNDDTEITQDLNESEMQAVYLKSVRSPALGNQYKMVHKRPSLTTVFSQVPEPEESYVADSFCVEDHEEGDPLAGNSGAESEECVDLDLLQEEESFVDGRKQYNTRHRRKRREGGRGPPERPGRPSRVCLLSSSSEEEEEEGGGVSSGGPRGVPPIPDTGRTSARVSPLPALDHSLPQRATCLPPPAAATAPLPLELQARWSEGLGFLPEGKGHGQRERLPRTLQEEPGRGSPASAPTPGRPPPALCVLADSREVASGPEVISTLKAAHGVKVQVCSLGGCDYVVSPRLAVERTRPAELMNGGQQSRAVQRVQQLKRTFDRICIIVEKERPKAGEVWRASQRTKRYDSLLSAFIRAGIRVLFSSGQEETAGLLAELVQVEQRKAPGAAMPVPTEAEGPRCEAFQFYLSIPGVSYPLALAFCHRFGSVREMVNSSPGEMAACAQVTRQKAEEVHRYIHYGFEAQMLPGVLT